MAMSLALTQLFRLGSDIRKVTEPQALGWPPPLSFVKDSKKGTLT